jgi:hypothetical protein
MVFGVVQGSAGSVNAVGQPPSAMTKANSTASIFPGGAAGKLGFASNAPRFQALGVNDESE